MGRAADVRLTPDIAREVCERAVEALKAYSTAWKARPENARLQ